jgi:cysteinyl-tRNA synthetase
MLRFFNTLTRHLEEFHPLIENQVRMYNCGPTVYDYAHIGNFRTFMFVDVLRRYLKYKGYTVEHVMNITDIDDKTIQRAQERGVSLQEFTVEYTRYFLEDFACLGGERPEKIVLATEHIDEMIALIEQLDANGYTYESDGSVYFRIAALPKYGKLSGAMLAGNRVGARVNVDEYDKEDARDFVLWKSAKEGEPSWPTKYGAGRPGWHLECSAMSMRYLGETFDIHSGGVDLIFPHHENEIAQSEGYTGKEFVRYWLHSEHLLVEGQKMSKRHGNFYTLRDLLNQGYSPLAVRHLLISVPYRKQLNFTLEGLKGEETRVKKLQEFRRRLFTANCLPGCTESTLELIVQARRDFELAMDDDLNTSAAFAVIAEWENAINKLLASETLLQADQQAARQLLEEWESVLGIWGEYRTEILDTEIQQLIEERLQARQQKNYARSDEIRQQLAAQGIILQDTKAGTDWRRE